jgi:hypothetical protein
MNSGGYKFKENIGDELFLFHEDIYYFVYLKIYRLSCLKN